MNPLIYAWPGHEPLAAAIASRVHGEIAPVTLRRFPDGETYVRLMTLPKDRDVILVCGLEQPDDKVCGLLFAADAARECGARRVGLVAPYLAYMRQDARFNAGEAIASRTFAGWLAHAIDWLVTMDPHLHRYRALAEIYPMPSAIASSATPIAQWIGENVAQPLIMGPDEESAQWAAAIARRVDCPWIALRKDRRGDRDVAVSVPDITAWPGRTPVLVDDIVSTARTMAAAAHRLRELGAAPPVCIGVHALFCGDALPTLRAAGPRLIVTCNTIRHETNAIDVTGEIAQAAANVHARLQPSL
jgi:ribose-phosphate pyrophosphokinase